jgi:hypothetical protein|tara:strand:- start:61 stop:282 length:222 start_codon:yes stop_codon:yes gene_type:complete
MKIKQNVDTGTAEIIFSWKEIWILIKHRKLKLTAEGLKDFSNILMKIVMEFNANFNEDLQKRTTDMKDGKGRK